MRYALFITILVIASSVISACSDDHANGPISSGDSKGSFSKSVPAAHHLVSYGGSAAAMTSAVQALGGTVRKNLVEINVAVVDGLSDAQAEALKNSPAISVVVRDQYLQWVPSFAEAMGSVLPFASSLPVAPQSDPKNAFYYVNSLQWNMWAISAEQAWQITKGSPEVRVGVLDTGISPDHVDLAGKYDLTKSINLSHSNPGDPADFEDRNFHGTHVSGTIASNSIGVAAVAPNVTLVGVKVLGDDGWGSWAQIMAGILYAADPAGGNCDIINMSLGGYAERSYYQQLIGLFSKTMNYARSQGVLVVCSAGNEKMDLDHNGNIVVLPLQAGTGMGVSATGQFQRANPDVFAHYSNYGRSAISVAAPGGRGDGKGTWYPWDGVMGPMAPAVARQLGWSNPTQRYTRAMGTSMAAPHVSGVAALIASQNPNANAGQMQTRIQNTADDLGAPGVDPYYGKGRLNAHRAVQ